MTFTVEQKNLLTKLMASENLTVEHQKIRTAKFDPQNRILYLPIWQNMEGFMYDHMGGHEVGHALYTPADGWHDVATDKTKGKNYKSFLNVVEDARIEKKVTRKFPGLKSSFRKGFQELMNRDFFGVKYRDVNNLAFIERLNLYTKSQYTMDVEFTTEEEVMIKKVQNLESWDDVLKLTGEIYEYSKEEQFEMEQLRDFKMNSLDSDDDYEDDGEYEDGEEADSEETESLKSDSHNKNNQDEDTEDEFESKSDSKINREKESAESNKDQFDPECRTDDSYRKNEVSLIDEKCKEYLYLTVPKTDVYRTFTSYKRVQELIGNYYDEQIQEGFLPLDKVKSLVSEFKNKNERYIGLLAKEFEMRKAAKAFSKSKLSDTGDIDINKLSSYQFDDNIFRKVMLIPKGKSHGLILLLDCSGSMSDNMSGSIEQILVLSMFCRKVNIPFRVFGFTNDDGTYNIDRERIDSRLYTERCFSDNINELALNNIQLREYLNSKMSNVEFSRSLRNMILLKEAYRSSNRNAGWTKSIGRPRSENLSNTPMIQSIFALGKVMQDFKSGNNLDMTSLVIVHDGDADSCSGYWTEREFFENDGSKNKKTFSQSFDIRSTNVVLRDTKHKFEYKLTTDAGKNYSNHSTEKLFEAALEWFRVTTKSKVFGFFILSNRSNPSKAAIRRRYTLDNGNCLDELRRTNYNEYTELDKKIYKKFKDDKFLVTNTKGYNSFYLVAGGNDLETEDEEIEIEGKVTSNKLKSAFMKFNKKKQVNRVLVSRFIQGMAT
jgi:hypothetical protein